MKSKMESPNINLRDTGLVKNIVQLHCFNNFMNDSAISHQPRCSTKHRTQMSPSYKFFTNGENTELRGGSEDRSHRDISYCA